MSEDAAEYRVNIVESDQEDVVNMDFQIQNDDEVEYDFEYTEDSEGTEDIIPAHSWNLVCIDL